MIFISSNSKVLVRYEVGTFVSPERRSICISRMFASTSSKSSPCSPRHPRPTCAHGTDGDSRERRCALAASCSAPYVQSLFPHRRSRIRAPPPSSRSPVAGRAMAHTGTSRGSAACSPGLGYTRNAIPGTTPLRNSLSPHTRPRFPAEAAAEYH